MNNPWPQYTMEYIATQERNVRRFSVTVPDPS